MEMYNLENIIIFFLRIEENNNGCVICRKIMDLV